MPSPLYEATPLTRICPRRAAYLVHLAMIPDYFPTTFRRSSAPFGTIARWAHPCGALPRPPSTAAPTDPCPCATGRCCVSWEQERKNGCTFGRYPLCGGFKGRQKESWSFWGVPPEKHLTTRTKMVDLKIGASNFLFYQLGGFWEATFHRSRDRGASGKR